jgi:hypothetical protein
MTTQQMIEALALSKNEVVASKCRKILDNETTIEQELKYCGSFMQEVLNGNYNEAIKRADMPNLQALNNYKKGGNNE